jgi:hypothetical protein
VIHLEDGRTCSKHHKRAKYKQSKLAIHSLPNVATVYLSLFNALWLPFVVFFCRFSMHWLYASAATYGRADKRAGHARESGQRPGIWTASLGTKLKQKRLHFRTRASSDHHSPLPPTFPDPFICHKRRFGGHSRCGENNR